MVGLESHPEQLAWLPIVNWSLLTPPGQDQGRDSAGLLEKGR